MTTEEIKEKVSDLRYSARQFADECFKLYKETDNPHLRNVANYLQYELTFIACKLSDMETTMYVEEQVSTASELSDMLDDIEDWWTDLDLRDKCEIANIPYPSSDVRGDEQIYAEDRAKIWWDSRTYEQKRDIYEETLAWWDCE